MGSTGKETHIFDRAIAEGYIVNQEMQNLPTVDAFSLFSLLWLFVVAVPHSKRIFTPNFLWKVRYEVLGRLGGGVAPFPLVRTNESNAKARDLYEALK